MAALIAAVVVFSLLMAAVAVKAQNTTFVSSACNPEQIPTGSPFFSDVGNVLVDLEKNTAANGYDYRARHIGGNMTAYGRGICNPAISQDQCKSCILNLGNDIWIACNNAIGARIKLVDCFIRYQRYSF